MAVASLKVNMFVDKLYRLLNTKSSGSTAMDLYIKTPVVV